VSNGRKARPLKTFPPRGPMRRWHTVGLDIPRQVARLQSLTPLLQATVILPCRRTTHNEQAVFGSLRNPVQEVSRQDRERDLGCIPRSDMAHCDAAGVNGSNRIFFMALRFADDAEWMSGKSRARLAPVLTEASSWMSDCVSDEWHLVLHQAPLSK